MNRALGAPAPSPACFEYRDCAGEGAGAPSGSWRYVLVGLSSCVLLAGCLTRPSLVKQSFALNEPVTASTNVMANGPVLAVRRLSVISPFDSQSFLYRTGDFSYERDPYAEFLAPPAESLAGPLRKLLRSTGAFREVAEPGSAVKPTVVLECYVTKLYGDFRQRTQPAAVLACRLIFLHSRNGGAEEVMLEKEYEERTGLKARTPTALVAGWNQCLKKIVSEAVEDYRGGSVGASERTSVERRSGKDQ